MTIVDPRPILPAQHRKSIIFDFRYENPGPESKISLEFAEAEMVQIASAR
jgi:hypothetical protein